MPSLTTISENFWIIRIPSIPLPSDLTSIQFIIPILYFLRSRVFHVHGLRQPSSLIACFWLSFQKKNVLVDTHDFFYQSHQLNYFGFNIYKILRKFEFQHIRVNLGKLVLNLPSIKIVSWGSICTDFLRKYYDYHGPIHQLSIGYDGFLFSSIKRNLKQNNNVELVFLGVLAPRKKPVVLLKILNSLPQNYSLKFIGGYSKSMKAILDYHIQKLELFNRVTFTGHLEFQDLPTALKTADIAIYPSSSSISCTQLLACGIPVLISSDQKFAYIAEETNTQVMVHDDDTEDTLVLKFSRQIMLVKDKYHMFSNRSKNLAKLYDYKQTFLDLSRLYFRS